MPRVLELPSFSCEKALRQAREDARAALMKSVRGGDLIGAVEEVGAGLFWRYCRNSQPCRRVSSGSGGSSRSLYSQASLQDALLAPSLYLSAQLGCAVAVARPSVGTWYMPLPLETAAPLPSPKEVASGLRLHVVPKLLSWLGSF